MGLFSKREKPATTHPISDFWEWWNAKGQSRFTKAIPTGEYGELITDIAAMVSAIDPGLQWETAKGRVAEHALIVTSGGIAELRPLAERWLRGAPAANPTWEFAAARRRDASVLDAAINIDGAQLDFAEARVVAVVDEDSQKIDVTVFHPQFPAMRRQGGAQVTFLFLDWLLGEDDVTRWLGVIEPTDTEPEGSRPLGELLDIVTDLESRQTEGEWVVMGATDRRGKPVLVSVIRPLRWIDRPLLDLHSEIRLPYAAQSDGLPTPEGLEEVGSYEDELVATLGGRAVLVAMVSTRGARTFHLYSDSEDQNSRDLIDRFRAGDAAKKAHELDPGWRAVRQFA
ncbi:DUF695 domain-containing protein [Glaciihabitans arcticus]|uniref:DUF695 domain-containing protein n=1 Tax=Glaciihabitans arcticus TaxID=2668039 RepID=A0A4Q9GRP1_9MICO|nr:DUF695 domain-containing protein [Glaciihabitans arcticus]TBN57632.1 DUF695 domain-containing protein [Glaciihabitans arcticus]